MSKKLLEEANSNFHPFPATQSHLWCIGSLKAKLNQSASAPVQAIRIKTPPQHSKWLLAVAYYPISSERDATKPGFPDVRA